MRKQSRAKLSGDVPERWNNKYSISHLVTSTQHLNCDLEGWSTIDTANRHKLWRKLPGGE